jgi:hypothetical protein
MDTAVPVRCVATFGTIIANIICFLKICFNESLTVMTSRILWEGVGGAKSVCLKAPAPPSTTGGYKNSVFGVFETLMGL